MRTTVKELENRMNGIDSRIEGLEKSNQQILSILEKLAKSQTTSTPTKSRKETTPISDSKVKIVEGEKGTFYKKGRLTVYETEYRGVKCWTVAAAKVPYKDKVTGEQKTFAPKENKDALKAFMKGKKLVDMTFIDEKGRKVTYQRPIWKTAEECLAAIR